jgi:hypothetical protein
MMANRRYRRETLRFLLLVGCLSLLVVENLHAQAYKTAVGYNQLVGELGGSLETGSGVKVALVEASFGAIGRYMPDTSNIQLSGKSIVAGSGPSNGNSGHALTVGQYFFGNITSMSPGVADVTVFEADDWLNSRLSPGGAGTPLTENFRVANHSWVARAADISEAAAVNRMMRMDRYVNQSGTSVVVAADNLATLPRLFTQGYNTISVGRSSGTFSSGLTTLYGSGRVKPDIVAPLDFTSYSTPVVSSAAAILHAKADNMGSHAADARRPEVIKSILMSGATKETNMNWDRTNARPLDEKYGAGQLNIRNSYYTMNAGQFNGHLGAPSSRIGLQGWDYESSLAGNDTAMYYEFAVGDWGVEDISVMLNWNIQVTDTNADPDIFDPSASLADLSLSLFDSSDNLVDFSNSTVDNVEHLWLSSLSSGTYRLRVQNHSSFSNSFALSWRMTAVPEPGSGGVLLLFAIGLVLRRTGRLAKSRA